MAGRSCLCLTISPPHSVIASNLALNLFEQNKIIRNDILGSHFGTKFNNAIALTTSIPNGPNLLTGKDKLGIFIILTYGLDAPPITDLRVDSLPAGAVRAGSAPTGCVGAG